MQNKIILDPSTKRFIVTNEPSEFSIQMSLFAKSQYHRDETDNLGDGRWRDPNGYIKVRIYKDSPFFSMARRFRDGDWHYVYEHRLVMAQHLGRPLKPWELVHHKPPGIKDDNRIENLVLTTHKRHLKEDRELVIELQEQVKDLEARITLLEAENILLRS